MYQLLSIFMCEVLSIYESISFLFLNLNTPKVSKDSTKEERKTEKTFLQ